MKKQIVNEDTVS